MRKSPGTHCRARPCCCVSHGILSPIAALQYLLDDPEHEIDTAERGGPGDFYYDRRLRFRVRDGEIQYRCMLWNDPEGWAPYVRSADCGRGKNMKSFVPVGHICKCCSCGKSQISNLEERVSAIEARLPSEGKTKGNKK